MQKLKPLDYKENYTDIIPEDSFRISPSMISKFSDKKWEWYQSQVLGNTIFEGSTSTVLGTIIHRIAEVCTKFKTNEEREVLRTEIPNYIESFSNNPEINIAHIKEQYKPMGNALLDYLNIWGYPDRSEEAIAYKVCDGVYAAGTADAVIGNTLIDYKTTSNQSVSEYYMPQNYKVQLLAYAWIYRKLGVDIQNIRIIWITNNIVGRVSEKTGKPLKDYPSKVIPVTQVITNDDMEFIESYLKLIAETYLKAKECPELTYLLFSDYRLKGEVCHQ
ncbi:PD-(D/E)XK nuclease family protein [Campylobacter sp. CLAX-22107-21]|uniref:PD-(D/E)XK nuclease family protein n=1 Tax=Campylobacter devanensis TaxID=3161138 RepID=UPI002E9D18C3|nr:PD-(D/E)XK nuclease family protein [Campylobacter sp. CLAX-22107-21]